MISLLTGCMQDLPATTDSGGGGGGNGKACGASDTPNVKSTATSQSTIAVQYAANTIPSKLSASVNGMAVVNECTLGTDNSSYLTVRTGNSVTVLLRVDGNAAMTEMFFNSDGSPKTNVQFQFVMKGRENCNDTPGSVYSTNQSLNWKPVYGNAEKTCTAGYSATVSN